MTEVLLTRREGAVLPKARFDEVVRALRSL